MSLIKTNSKHKLEKKYIKEIDKGKTKRGGREWGVEFRD